MYLKKLELVGFKSFATKTVLDFLPECDIASGARCGITAIVGPNGSGKSNVADAIRWAIGEQSSKNLRGKKSEDVIFAGTEGKTRLGSASVTLYFDNTDKRIPIEFAEVSITRKIYRDGEGEYFINGSRVRLLDIVDLLAKAGIGKDSYCVINQGMSDAVLNATPLERRSIFEDAAGVKQYQIERERALRKLENTQENLAQVDALVAEIEPHLKNLRRQAEKAAQAKDLSARLREKQELLYGALWHAFTEERSLLTGKRSQLESEIIDIQSVVTTLRSEAQVASTAMETNTAEQRIEQELEKIRASLNDVLKHISLSEGRLEGEREKRKERESIEIIPVDLSFVQVRLEEVIKLQSEIIERLAAAEKMEDLQDIKEFATVIRERVTELRRQAGEGSIQTKKIFGLSEAEQRTSDERLQVLEAELQKAKDQSLEYESLLIKKNTELSQIREAGKMERETFFAREREAREKEYALQKKKDELNELRISLARVEVREEDLTMSVKEELSLSPDDIVYDGTPIERDKLEREVARLKVEVEHVGTIDPLVMDEYRETEKRFTFLTHESQDLKEAIEKLRAIAREMDGKINVAFHEAFKEINRKFEAYFKVIFAGGRASLEMVKVRIRQNMDEEGDEEGGGREEGVPEKTEVGIEISACPPGKRIHNLSMLSGGERSLTSLALLFAIISHNPPPFAILDEVEAALDEANSRRFSKMLSELSEHTQFIAITHNRETMKQAVLLYGVTMAQDGVSKLLSIRLDQVGEAGKLKGK